MSLGGQESGVVLEVFNVGVQEHDRLCWFFLNDDCRYL